MKKYFYLLVSVALLSACQNNTSTTNNNSTTTTQSGDAPVVSVKKAIYEFGTIAQGEKVQHEFEFTNTGKSPLIITNASATCGCTVPEFPTEPVKPGESGIIKVVFNSSGKSGLQDKIITITSNAEPAIEQLHLVGDVIVKK